VKENKEGGKSTQSAGVAEQLTLKREVARKDRRAGDICYVCDAYHTSTFVTLPTSFALDEMPLEGPWRVVGTTSRASTPKAPPLSVSSLIAFPFPQTECSKGETYTHTSYEPDTTDPFGLTTFQTPPSVSANGRCEERKFLSPPSETT
jgi:hypothetical protein